MTVPWWSVVGVVLTGCVFGQEPAEAPTFQADTNIVLIPAVVRDSKGQVVGGLSTRDFRVTIDGKVRRVLGVDLESYNRTDSSDYPQQFDAWLFDDLHLGFQDMEQARSAFEKHLADTTLAGRRVAIFTASGRVTTPFTNSREQLLQVARSIRPVEAAHTGSECPDISYYVAHRIMRQRDQQALGAVLRQIGVCMGPLPPALARQIVETESTRVLKIETQAVQTTFATMRRMLTGLATKPGSKNILLLSAGFLVADEKEREILSEIVDEAGRQRVAVSAVNAHGLHGRNQNLAGEEISDVQVAAGLRTSADWLVRVADETGGMYIGHSNDLRGGLKRIAEPAQFKYYLSVSAPASARSVKVHKIDVAVAGRRNVSVQSRSTYRDAGETSATEQVKAVLYSGVGADGLRVTMTAERTAGSKLRVAAALAGSDIPLVERNTVQVNSIAVGYAVFDRDGVVVGDAVRVVDLKLSPASVPKLRSDGFRLGTEFEVKPGVYLVRVVVKESGSGRLGSFGRMVTVAD